MLSRHRDIHLDKNAFGFRLTSCFNNYKKVLPYNLEHKPGKILSWLVRSDYRGRLLEILGDELENGHADVRSLVKAGIANVLARNKKAMLGDKAPNLHFFLGDVLQIAPETKFIHVIRDGRSTAFSANQRAYRNLKLAAQEWVDGTIMGLSNQMLLGAEKYILIKYESLLRDPERVGRKICSFLDLEYDPAILDIKGGLEVSEVESYVKTSFDTSKISAYREALTEKQLRSIEQLQGPLLRHLDYRLTFPNSTVKYQPLNYFKRIWLNQRDNFGQLFRSRQMAMIERKYVPQHVPLRSRLKRFALNVGRDFLPDQIFKSLFRKVWTKELYYSD